MKNILIIAKKELIDLTRDKRTMLTMVIIPLLLFPLIMSISGNFASKQIEKEAEKKLVLLVEGEQYADSLFSFITKQQHIDIFKNEKNEIADTLLKNSTIDAILFFDKGFDSTLYSGGTAITTIKYKSTDYDIVRRKLSSVIDQYKNGILDKRLKELGISEATINPIHTNFKDISSQREKFGKTMGGMVPYIFIIFSYIGCMYPAIDLFTNEKERGTLETILSTPVNRLQILFGKMSIVSLTGLVSALLSIVGLTIGMNQFSNSMPQEVFGSISIYTEPSVIILLVSMLIPLVIFNAGIMTIITNYARSYKEAQSLLSPLMIVIIVPAVMGMMPFIELNNASAFIPITNIALAAKEIIAGTLNYTHYAFVVFSLCIYAVISVFVASIWFGKEKNILRV